MPQNISCLVGICTVCKQEKCPLFGNRKIYTSHLGKCMGLGNCINCLSCTQIWSGVEFQKIFATLIGNDRYNHIQCKFSNCLFMLITIVLLLNRRLMKIQTLYCLYSRTRYITKN